MDSRPPGDGRQLSLEMDLGADLGDSRLEGATKGATPRRRSARAKEAQAGPAAPAPASALEPANEQQAAVLEHLATALATGAIRAARRALDTSG